MSFRLYEFRSQDRPRLAAELTLEPLWRLAYSEREASHFGLERETFFVLLEGEEWALRVADDQLLRYGRRAPQAEALLLRFRAEDTLAATGIGTVFGPVEFKEQDPSLRHRRNPLFQHPALRALQERWRAAPKPWPEGEEWWRVWRWRVPRRAQDAEDDELPAHVARGEENGKKEKTERAPPGGGAAGRGGPTGGPGRTSARRP